LKKKDEGAIHKLFVLLLLTWTVICCGVFMEIMRVGYVNRYLQDCITQANLASILIDPYHYGSTGELVFENVEETKQNFGTYLEKSLGSEAMRSALGIDETTEVMDFRIYEVTEEGTMEFVFDNDNYYRQNWFDRNEVVNAPDGTTIQSSSIYSKIAVPINFMFGIEWTSIKEHCVDIVSEENI
jgi:hypothetical protein